MAQTIWERLLISFSIPNFIFSFSLIYFSPHTQTHTQTFISFPLLALTFSGTCSSYCLSLKIWLIHGWEQGRLRPHSSKRVTTLKRRKTCIFDFQQWNVNALVLPNPKIGFLKFCFHFFLSKGLIEV